MQEQNRSNAAWLLPAGAGRLLPLLVLAVAATLVLCPPAAASRDRVPSIAEITRALKVNRTYQRQLAPYIEKIARQYRLDPELVHAVITVESAYDAKAVSRAGAMGLMQLMPATAERFGVDDPFSPIANINAGARYLRILLNKFGTIQLALAAYNAGEGRVRSARNTIPNIPETRRYVVSVIHFYMRYKQMGL